MFLLVFVSMYSGLHLYGLSKVRQAQVLNTPGLLSLILFMAIMIFAPIGVRLLENAGFDKMARMLAYVGYTWMGLLFLFISAAFALDVYKLLLMIGKFIFQKNLTHITPSPQLIFLISIIFSILAVIYGSFEATRIQTEHITLNTPKIPPAIGRARSRPRSGRRGRRRCLD